MTCTLTHLSRACARAPRGVAIHQQVPNVLDLIAGCGRQKMTWVSAVRPTLAAATARVCALAHTWQRLVALESSPSQSATFTLSIFYSTSPAGAHFGSRVFEKGTMARCALLLAAFVATASAQSSVDAVYDLLDRVYEAPRPGPLGLAGSANPSRSPAGSLRRVPTLGSPLRQRAAPRPRRVFRCLTWLTGL